MRLGLARLATPVFCRRNQFEAIAALTYADGAANTLEGRAADSEIRKMAGSATCVWVERMRTGHLTFKHDQAGRRHPIFGVLDHGSRMAVVLKPLTDTTAITLLRALLDAIEALGRSTAIRSDNESMFHSRLVKRALAELRAPAPARTTPVGGGGAGAWPAEFFVNVVGAWQGEPPARAERSGRVSVAQ